MDNIERERQVYEAARLKLFVTKVCQEKGINSIKPDNEYLAEVLTPSSVDPWFDFMYYKNLQKCAEKDIRLKGGFLYRLT